MIPTLFCSVDVADARDKASEFAAGFASAVTVVHGPLTVSEVPKVRETCSPLHLQVVNVDGVSPSATEQLLSLVRQGLVVGYSTTIQSAAGVHVQRSGLRSDDSVYVALSESGMRSSEAAQCARIGRGSADRGAQGLSLLSSRSRIVKMLDAIRSHDLPGTHTSASALTGDDIWLIREAVHEVRTGDFALWSQREVEIFAKHVDFVSGTVSDYFVRSPQTTALTLAMGLYFAECGLIS